MGRVHVVIWAKHCGLGPIGRHPGVYAYLHTFALSLTSRKVYPMSQSDCSPTTFATGNCAIALLGSDQPSPWRQLYHVRDKKETREKKVVF